MDTSKWFHHLKIKCIIFPWKRDIKTLTAVRVCPGQQTYLETRWCNILQDRLTKTRHEGMSNVVTSLEIYANTKHFIWVSIQPESIETLFQVMGTIKYEFPQPISRNPLRFNPRRLKLIHKSTKSSVQIQSIEDACFKSCVNTWKIIIQSQWRKLWLICTNSLSVRKLCCCVYNKCHQMQWHKKWGESHRQKHTTWVRL